MTYVIYIYHSKLINGMKDGDKIYLVAIFKKCWYGNDNRTANAILLEKKLPNEYNHL